MSSASMAAASPQATVTEAQARALDLVADARADHRLGALAPCADLTAVAQKWSERMARTGALGHNPHVRDVVGEWRAWGENVGVGGSVGVVHEALMDSRWHRANLLSTTFTQVGVGVAEGRGRTWVTQVFRAPASGQGCRPLAMPRT